MKKWLLGFLFCFPISVFTQVTWDTLQVKPSSLVEYNQPQQLDFPLFKTGNKKVDEKITGHLAQSFTQETFPVDSLQAGLDSWAASGLVHLSFEVTYNQKDLVSLVLYAEGCGAYCSSWRRYFTYATTTGKPISIADLVRLDDSLSQKIMKDKQEQLIENEMELLEMVKKGELDTTSLEWAMNYYNQCDEQFSLSEFILHQEEIEWVFLCELPHAIRNLTPIVELKYSYPQLQDFLLFEP